jgi:hypothetical protein
MTDGLFTGSRFILLAVVMAVSACATERTGIPTISEPPREGLLLSQPVLFAVQDARVEKSDSKAVVAALEQGIIRAYGSAVDELAFYGQVPGGRVAVRIRLLAYGAEFGSRTISAVAITDAISRARASASGTWLPVVDVVAERSSVTTVFAAEGWWVGTAWLDLEIIDRREGDIPSFTLPIVAEEREPNALGYRSADRASERAWGRASQQLFRVMDSLLMAVRDDES